MHTKKVRTNCTNVQYYNAYYRYFIHNNYLFTKNDLTSLININRTKIFITLKIKNMKLEILPCSYFFRTPDQHVTIIRNI